MNKINIEEIFGQNVFSLGVMKEYIESEKAYADVVEIIKHGGELNLETADIVADAMKRWAIERGLRNRFLGTRF